MAGMTGIDPRWGLTVVRVAMAVVLIVAGWDKLSGGLAGTTGFFTKVGIPAPELTAPFIMLLELVGGILLLIGLAGRWLGLLFAIEFLVAFVVAKLPTAGWAASRLDLMLLAGGLALFLGGAGKLSVDDVWRRRRR